MSRGHGAVERAILDAMDRCEFVSLPFVAKMNRYDWAKESVRQSFSRAARRLADAGKIDLYTCSLPYARGFDGELTGYRPTLCPARPGLKITDDVFDGMWRSTHGVFLLMTPGPDIETRK